MYHCDIFWSQISIIYLGSICINGIAQLSNRSCGWVYDTKNTTGEIYLHTPSSKISNRTDEVIAAIRRKTTGGIYLQPVPLVYIAYVYMNFFHYLNIP
jgi:hypothetical protein